MRLRFRIHVESLPGCPDVVFSRKRKAIFVHGCFWHQHSCNRGARIPEARRRYWTAKLNRNRQRDKEHVKSLRKMGWRVLIVWECETKPTAEKKLLGRLSRFLVSLDGETLRKA